VIVLHLYTKFVVRRPFRSEDMTYFRSQHYVGVVTLTFAFHLETGAYLLPVGWTTFLPVLVFIGRFVLDLSANICQTHHVTLRPWPLTFDLETGMHYCRWVGNNLPTNFGVSVTIHSPLMGHQLSDGPRDLATLNFDLGGHDACPWYMILPVSALVGLATLTFDLWSRNLCSLMPVRWTTFPSILVFLDVSFSTYWSTPVRRVTWPCELDLWPWRSWRL